MVKGLWAAMTQPAKWNDFLWDINERLQGLSIFNWLIDTGTEIFCASY